MNQRGAGGRSRPGTTSVPHPICEMAYAKCNVTGLTRQLGRMKSQNVTYLVVLAAKGHLEAGLEDQSVTSRSPTEAYAKVQCHVIDKQRDKPSIRTSLAARFLHTTTHRLRAVMSQRLWAAAAVLTVIAVPALSQKPAAPLPRPQRPAPTNVTVTTAVPSATASGITLDSTLLAGFRWRNIGPANMGGRVSSV